MDLLSEFQTDLKQKLLISLTKERESNREEQRISEEKSKIQKDEDKKIGKNSEQERKEKKIILMKKTELKVIRKINLEPKHKEERIVGKRLINKTLNPLPKYQKRIHY